MFLNPNVEIILFLDLLFVAFLVIALWYSVQIVNKWDFHSTASLQYELEKRSYLIATIIKYIFFLKLPLFLFFIYSVDQLSDIIVGAMCAAGVIDASSYGIPLLILKLMNLYLFGFWLIIHYGDLKVVNLPFTKVKFGFFIVAALLIILEIILDFFMFDSIDLSKIAVCCGALFSNASTTSLSLFFTLPVIYYGVIFYFIYFLLVVAYLKKNDLYFPFINLLFLIISILSLIMFFGTYIYELPTHHCPFCILQKEYHYVGYYLYISLFIGTFYGVGQIVANLIDGDKKLYFNLSIIFNTIYMVIVSYYFFGYYLKNGVLL